MSAKIFKNRNIGKRKIDMPRATDSKEHGYSMRMHLEYVCSWGNRYHTHSILGSNQRDSDAGRDWGQEEKRTTEDEMAGWHH